VSGQNAWKDRRLTTPVVIQMDIHASDALAQQRFYTALFDWTATPPDRPEEYTWLMDDAGCMYGGIGQAEPDASPGISFFVEVDDVAATLAEAGRLGGGTWWGPSEAPDGMVTGCLRDPDGTGILLISLGASGQPYASRPPVAADHWQWEIQTPDPDRAIAFYRGLFGWEIAAANQWGWSVVSTGQDAGPDGAIAQADTPCVFFYVQVGDVPDMEQRAIGLGARPLVAPWEIPDGVTIAVVADPEGNRLGFLQRADVPATVAISDRLDQPHSTSVKERSWSSAPSPDRQWHCSSGTWTGPWSSTPGSALPAMTSAAPMCSTST
jgi:predicted enzyme related to lactoylglutathione lyase